MNALGGRRVNAPAAARRLLAAIAIAIAVLLPPAASRAEEPAVETVRPDVLQVEGSSGLHYLELTTGGAEANDPVPLVVAIHGLGDRPESFRLLLDDLPVKARLILPRGPMPHGQDGFSWFSFHADDEEGTAELGEGIRQASERISKLIAALSKKYESPSRAVICGFSQGGMLAFALAAAHPSMVAAAIPVSGYLPSTLWPTERPMERPLPKILALHGETDRLVPLESARWSVEALRSNGYDAQLRSWPAVSHALSPGMRSALMTSVVAAVEEVSAPGTVLEGPPAPRPAPSAPPIAATP